MRSLTAASSSCEPPRKKRELQVSCGTRTHWEPSSAPSCHVVTAVPSPRDQKAPSLPAGSIQPPQRRQEAADGEHEVLRREATEHIPAGRWPGSGNPLCLDALSAALLAVGGE